MLDQRVDGRRRVVIENVSPEIDCGRFAIKRVVGETVVVEADVFADGHDSVACRVLYWQNQAEQQTAPMRSLGNDRWRGEFSVSSLGRYRYSVEGWIDRFQTWRVGLQKRVAAKQDVQVELLIGAGLIDGVASRAAGEDARLLREWARRLRESTDQASGAAIALEEDLMDVVSLYPDRELASRYEKQLAVTVDREKGAVFDLV